MYEAPNFFPVAITDVIAMRRNGDVSTHSDLF
jgi:hypothetical protein